MSFLKRLFGGNAPPRFDTPVAPDSPAFIIGDLHGCKPQLMTLLAKMDALDPDAPRVFVGDYVDRGEDSAGVLRTLFEIKNDPQVTCLIGNHEDMMLGFLDKPETKGQRWLRYGGLQTLASFGIGGVTNSSEGAALITARDALLDAMGADMHDWLRNLPATWKTGNLTVVHAGADPVTPLALQPDKTFKWGHRDFATTLRTDGTWVAHGHTIVDAANSDGGKIAVDTGAYATGILTAAYVTQGDVTFVQTR
ncbi:metallophosphoesterase [Loktanella sp. F6476L]|uniref:metallophosphoesterase n=1 Tax=Loktanella sp. F6476L TaxID=2926405 RepID=UPI001FF19771|nr:metallophosphoesterase [Loktanella sp. F6476L]MCK0122141.1 metallophosphoesterase [Loktanella sp. F6476L]